MPEVTNMKGPSEKLSVSQGDKKSLAKSRNTDDDSKDTDTDDDMTSLPDYLLPVQKTMSANFRSLHEEHLVSRLMTKWNMVKNDNQQTREQARRVVRKIAVEELTKDWMSSDIDAEIRAFMIDNILPTLVLGVEKLLVEVDKRNLVESSVPDNNFNPLNFLAQYLMRNNPKYSNYAEASPYMRGLRSVSEELKSQLLSYADNKLMQVKMLTRSKRQEREAAESVTVIETQRRINALQQQFMEWGNGKKIDLAMVQNALLSFVEMVSQMSPEVRSEMRLSKELDPTDDTGKGVHQTDFVEYLMPFVSSVSNKAFDMLMSHLSSCAKIYRYSLKSSERKTALSQLFKSCDSAKVGLLSRHRILELLTAFYHRLSPEVKSSLRDPGQWPVREISELEDDETCEEEVSEDVQMLKPGIEVERVMNPDAEGIEIAKTDSSTSDKDILLVSSQEELHLRKLSSEVVERAINDAKVMFAAAEGNPSPLIQETSASMTPSLDAAGKEDGALVKAVSAGSRMIDRGIAFVDRAKLDNWTGTLAYSSLSQSQLCVFNEYTLNLAQFVQLIDTFLNVSVDSALFNQLLSYIKEGYVLVEDEKTLKIMKERLTAEELQRKAKLNRLFDIWDNEGSGYLNCDEVAWIIGTYKDLREHEVAEKALAAFQEKYNFNDDRFTKHEFRDFLRSVVEVLPRGETFDMFVDFLIGSMALSYAEQARGDARKKWLQQMIVAAETSGSNMEPVYKSLFDAITKDAELHGDEKSVSISIALLERNLLELERGTYILRYTAATPDHSKHVLGKVVYKDMKGISFAAVTSGRPIHVPNISKHGNIHFWDPEKNAENTKGSFIAIPLKDKKKRVFGLLSIDTINDPRNQKTVEPEEVIPDEDLETEELAEDGGSRKSSISCIFAGHEIQFYQGIAKAFSIAYHLVNVRQKMMQTSEHALSWIVTRCPHMKESTLYLVESTRETMDIVLRKMMVTESHGSVNVYRFDPPQLERKDNFFREYLFKCADSSELVAMTAYNELHLAIPLRNNDGQTVIVYDVNLGDLQSLPKSEMFEMTRTLRLLQAAYQEISIESQEGTRTTVLKGDQLDNDTRTEILFGRLMLLKLRQSISKLDGSTYAKLRNDEDFTEVSHPVVKAVLCLLDPDLAQRGNYEDWQKCQPYIGPSTGAKIVLYDPTEHSTTDTPVTLIDGWLKDITYEKIAKHRSLLVRHLYNWICISLSLIKCVSHENGHQLDLASE